MKLIKALVSLIVVLFAAPVMLYQRYKEKQREQQRITNTLVDESLMQFYEFLLTREELSDEDIAYLLKEHKQRVYPCIAEIVREGKPMPTNVVLAQAMQRAIAY